MCSFKKGEPSVFKLSRQWVSCGLPVQWVHVPLLPDLQLLRHRPDHRWLGDLWGCCWCWCLVLRSSHSVFFYPLFYSQSWIKVVKLENQSQVLMERIESPSLGRLFSGGMTLPSLYCFLCFLALFLVSWEGCSWCRGLLSHQLLRCHLSCYLLLFLKIYHILWSSNGFTPPHTFSFDP